MRSALPRHGTSRLPPFHGAYHRPAYLEEDVTPWDYPMFVCAVLGDPS